MTVTETKVQEIMRDRSLDRDEKIARLRDLETEARALERAASESPMNAEDGLDADLRIVRLALEKLGAGDRSGGAATL